MERRRLATARYEKGWSQEELAERVGVTRNTLSKWERGIVAPYPLHVHRLCSLFGKTAAELDLEKTSRKSQQKAVKEVAQNTPAVPSVSSITLEKSASPVPVILDSPFLQSVEPETQRWFRPADHDMLLSIQTERVSLDLEEPTAWFGRKLAYLLTIVEECCGHQELQQKMGNVLNSMQPKANDKEYTLSRRQLLITLATLPTVLLLTILQGRLSTGRIEQFLARSAASLAACWHLMRGCEYSSVEELLPTYLPLLTNLAQEHSKYQSTAASLATQAYRLKGILALHNNDARARDIFFQQAMYYAQIAQNPGLFVAALISLAYHKPDPVEAEQLYQRALVYKQTLSPLQRCRLYVELSVAYAQQNREDEAIQYLYFAQQEYPKQPENDPSFLYAEFDPSSMILEKGRVHLALTHYQPDGQHPQQAWETFAHVETSQSTLALSERIRYEIVNYQAETALVLRDRDLCCNYIEQGVQGAVLLGSARRRKEVLATTNKALKLWPHEGRVKELKHLFA